MSARPLHPSGAGDCGDRQSPAGADSCRAFEWRFLLPKYWPIWLLYLLCGFLGLLPNRVRAGLADGVARVLFHFDSRRKQIALRNIALCFPEFTAARWLEIYREYTGVLAPVFLEYGLLMFRSRRSLMARFDQCDVEILHELRRAGRNVILLTPHRLALEYGGQWLGMQFPVISVVRRHTNALLDWIVCRFRTRHGSRVHSQAASMLPLVRAVHSGSLLYYLPDDIHGSQHGDFVPFFGVPKSTSVSLGRLAEACRAAVVPTLIAYCPRRRRFSVRCTAPIADFPSGDPARDATLMNLHVERIIREDPAQYFWGAKIFKRRPPGGADLYADRTR